MDAMAAVNGREIAKRTFFDFSGGSLGNLLNVMDYAQGASSASRSVTPPQAGSMAFLVNFPPFWKMLIDMLARGSGFTLKHEILVPGQDLRAHEGVARAVDIAVLPKAIGGDAVSVDEESGEEDERCALGFQHPRISTFMKKLESEIV